MTTTLRRPERKLVDRRVSARLIHRYVERLDADDGAEFAIRAYASQRRDGVWESWLEFSNDVGQTRCTPVETTQASLGAVEHWAAALEPVYLEGAFTRARRAMSRRPSPNGS